MELNQIQAIFVDRDGTIGGSDNVTYPGEFKLFPFVQESINLLKLKEKAILSFTNQPGISRGEAIIKDFEEELLSFGFDRMYLCPHLHENKCDCRKPSPGMLIKAAAENNLDLKRCVVIGDRWTDMVAAEAVGSIKILVRTGSGEKDLRKYNNNEFYGEWADACPDYVAEDFNDAVKWLLR